MPRHGAQLLAEAPRDNLQQPDLQLTPEMLFFDVSAEHALTKGRIGWRLQKPVAKDRQAALGSSTQLRDIGRRIRFGHGRNVPLDRSTPQASTQSFGCTNVLQRSSSAQKLAEFAGMNTARVPPNQSQ